MTRKYSATKKYNTEPVSMSQQLACKEALTQYTFFLMYGQSKISSLLSSIMVPSTLWFLQLGSPHLTAEGRLLWRRVYCVGVEEIEIPNFSGQIAAGKIPHNARLYLSSSLVFTARYV
jgi:hypothetical protein